MWLHIDVNWGSDFPMQYFELVLLKWRTSPPPSISVRVWSSQVTLCLPRWRRSLGKRPWILWRPLRQRRRWSRATLTTSSAKGCRWVCVQTGMANSNDHICKTCAWTMCACVCLCVYCMTILCMLTYLVQWQTAYDESTAYSTTDCMGAHTVEPVSASSTLLCKADIGLCTYSSQSPSVHS